MTLKKIKVLSFIVVFALTFLFHFLYVLFPNFLFSILFPVNESIFEHMKLLYSAFVFWGIIEYFILKKLKIPFNNYWKSLFLISFTSMIFYLILYLPFYHFLGENFLVSVILLMITIVLEEIFSYYLLLDNKNSFLNKISPILIILFYFVFLILTYNPIHNYIFYDSKNNCYGLIDK